MVLDLMHVHNFHGQMVYKVKVLLFWCCFYFWTIVRQSIQIAENIYTYIYVLPINERPIDG